MKEKNVLQVQGERWYNLWGRTRKSSTLTLSNSFLLWYTGKYFKKFMAKGTNMFIQVQIFEKVGFSNSSWKVLKWKTLCMDFRLFAPEVIDF